MSRGLSWALLLVSLAMYALGACKLVQDPIDAEEPWVLYAAQAINTRGSYDSLHRQTQASAFSKNFQSEYKADVHPPLTAVFIAKMQRWVGDYPLAGRFFSMGCVLATALLLLVMGRGILGSWSWARVAMALYLSCPMVLQSSAVLDLDASIFTLAFAVFTGAVLLFLRTRRAWGMFLLGLTWGFCLLAKLTSALLLPIVLLAWIAAHPKVFSPKALGMGALGFLAGLGLFYLGLALLGFSSERLFWYAFFRAGQRVEFSWLTNVQVLMRSVIGTLLWASPFLFGLLAIATGQQAGQWRRGQSDPGCDFLLLSALAFVPGYTLIGGLYFQFPRYIMPAMPAVCLLAARTMRGYASADASQGIRVPAIAACAIGGGIWYFGIAGDYLHPVLFGPKAVLLGWRDGFAGLALEITLRLTAYALPFALLLLWARKFRPVLSTALLVLGLASFWGLDARQATASYSTYYNYGEEGRWESIRRIAALPLHQEVFAPHPHVYYRADAVTTYAFDKDWSSPEKILEIAARTNNAAVVYGVMDLPLSYARGAVRAPETVEGLRNLGYEKEIIGTMTHWHRDPDSP